MLEFNIAEAVIDYVVDEVLCTREDVAVPYDDRVGVRVWCYVSAN